MHRKTLTIESKPTQEGKKSRSFSVELVAHVLANDMWSLGATAAKERSASRPVLLAYAGTSQASRAFSANLRDGRPATLQPPHTSRFEIPKSAGFRYETFSQDGATLTLAYLPTLISIDPLAAEAEDIAFLCLPPTWWVDEQAAAAASVIGGDAREAVIAAYFVAFLDKRSPLPIANHLAFHLQLYRAALEQSWCTNEPTAAAAFDHSGLESIGFETAICCNVSRSAFAQFLAAQTSAHLPRIQEISHHGSTRIHRPGRLLSHPSHSVAQLGVPA